MFAKVINGAVVSEMTGVPECTENVSGFNLLPIADQIAHGYYPLIVVKDGFNPATEKLPADPVYTIGATEVTATYTKIALSVAELEANMAKAKADKTAYINTACGTEIVGGFDSAALGTLHHYTATLEDQANLLGLIAIGLGGEFTCIDGAGVKARRLHTLAQLKQVLVDGGTFKDVRLAKARTLKDRIDAAPSVDLPDAAAVEALAW